MSFPVPSNAILFHFRKVSFLSKSLEHTRFLGECIGKKLQTSSVDFNWATIGLLSLPENGKTTLAKSIMMTAVDDGKSQFSVTNHRDISRWETRVSKKFGISRHDRQLKIENMSPPLLHQKVCTIVEHLPSEHHAYADAVIHLKRVQGWRREIDIYTNPDTAIGNHLGYRLLHSSSCPTSLDSIEEAAKSNELVMG